MEDEGNQALQKKNESIYAYTVKIMNASKKSDYTMVKFSKQGQIETISDLKSELLARFTDPLSGDIEVGYIQPGHGLRGKQEWLVMMMTFKRCMIFIQGRSQYSCGVLKRLVVTARPLENDQEAVHHHKQVMHRKSHEAQPTMNPTKEIKLQRPMKHLLSWRRSMEINIPVNNCVPGLISFS